MNEQKTRVIEHLEADIEKIQKRMAEVMALPDDLPGMLSASEYGILIWLPYDLTQIRQVRATLGADYKTVKELPPRVDSDGDFRMNLVRKDDYSKNISIIANPSREGSTCRKVQCGTKEVPVYKIVCD